MLGLTEGNRSLKNYVIIFFGLRIKKLEYRFQNLLSKTYEERIREFFPTFIREFGVNRGAYCEIDMLLTNKDIAQLTNTTRQKVNEVMNLMEKEGLLSYDRKSIKLYK